MNKKLKSLEQIKKEFYDIIYYNKNHGSIHFIGRGHIILPEMKKYFGTVIDVELSTVKGRYDYLGFAWLDEWFEDEFKPIVFIKEDEFEL